MYALTYWKLKKQAKNIALQNSRESRAQEIRIQKEKYFFKTVILIICVAFLCTVPSMVFFQIYDSWNSDLWNDILVKMFLKIFTFIFYANFGVNPIIYVIYVSPSIGKHFIYSIAEERIDDGTLGYLYSIATTTVMNIRTGWDNI